MKQLRSHNILSGPANLKVPAGQYGALALRFSGTNQAGQTLTLANCGNITATWRSVSFMSVPVTEMNILNAHVGGVPESATAAGAAFTHTVVILPSYVGDGNVFDVVETDEFYISVDLSGVTGVIVASGTVTLLGLPQLGAMAYLPHIMSQVANVPASGSFQYDINHDNCAFILLSALTNVSRQEIVRDRLVEVSCTPAEGLAMSNYFDRLETARTDDILFNMVHSGMFDESLADDVHINIFAGAGGAATPVITAICMDGTPDTLARSRDSANAFVNATKARKVNAGKMRAVTVSNALKPVATAAK